MLAALPRLRRFALSLTGNQHDADDLMQATVERTLEHGMPTGADAARWMFKVCRNVWIDEIRARDVRRRSAQSPELAEEPSVSGEAIALGELALREVEAAMATLPEEQRAVVSLVAIDELTYREAADVLDVPIGTIMSRLARARAALSARLEPAPQRAAPAARAKETRHG